jgi:hypothetical protein
MPILEGQLEQLLRTHVPALTGVGYDAVVDTAIYDSGKLVALYYKPMRPLPRAQLNAFFVAARARLGDLGDPNGGEVRENEIWSVKTPPCADKDNWTCWVG